MRIITILIITAFVFQVEAQNLPISWSAEKPEINSLIFGNNPYTFGFDEEIFQELFLKDQTIPDEKANDHYLKNPALYPLKNQQNNIVLIDSLLKFSPDVLNEKYMFYYDDEGFLQLSEFFNFLVVWDPETPFQYNEFSYDESGNLISHKNYMYDFEDAYNGDYLINYQFEYDFDQYGYETLRTRQYFNFGTNNMISPSERWISDYDHMHDRLIYELRQLGSGSEWLNNRLYEVELFENGKIKSNISKVANSEGVWTTGLFIEYIGWNDNYNLGFTRKNWSVSLQDWVNLIKWEPVFDENGTPVSAQQYNWDEDQQSWWVHRHVTYITNELNLLVTQITQSRDNPDADLVNFSMSSLVYDENQNAIERIDQNWDASEELWVNSTRILNQFSAEGYLNESLTQNWNTDNQEWFDVRQRLLNFNDNGINTYNATLLWSLEFETWYFQAERITEYDESGRLILFQNRSIQSPETFNWAFGWRQVYEYDTRGNRILYTREVLDFVSVDLQEFVFINYETYLHDFYGNLKQEKTFQGNMEQLLTLSIGYGTYEVAMEIISQGIPLEGVTLTIGDESWVSDPNGWVNANVVSGNEMDFQYTLSKDGFLSKTDDLYIDRNQSLTVAMVPEDIQLYNVTFIISMHDDFLENAAIVLTGYGELFTNNEGTAIFEGIAPQENIPFSLNYQDTYYEGELSVVDQDVIYQLNLATLDVWENEIDHNLRFYPNPADNYLNIKLNETGNWQFEIFNIHGKLVAYDKFGGGDMRIDIAHLDSGLYILRISGNNQIMVEKFLVR